MNILFVATVYNHLAAFHKPFIKYFQEKGYTVHVAGSNSMGRKDELEQLGAICHDISFDKSILSKNNRRALQELNELFDNIHFDLIHVHTPIAAFLVRFVLRKKKLQGPLLYTAHGFHFFKGAPKKNWFVFYNAEKIAKRWTDAIIVMNKEDLELSKKMGFENNHNLFFVNGVGVDLNDFSERAEKGGSIRTELNLSQDDVLISCVAELSYRKNQMFLLKNWDIINRNNPQVHLLFIGEGQDEGLLKSYVQSQNLKNVHFLGFRRDMPKILNDTNIVTLTSLHEGLPRCLMEAIALGKPIIATDVRGSRDLVQDGYNGYLVNLNDDDLLVKRFNDLIMNVKLQIDMGENGKKRSGLYDLDFVLKQMDEIYMNFLK